MDSFEKLIPILFLIIWSIVALMGKKKKQKKPLPEPNKKPAKVNSFLGDIKDTVENFLNELEQPSENVIPDKLNLKGKKDKSVSEPVDIELKIPDKTVKTLSQIPEESAYTIHKKSSSIECFSVKKLREAVIWSEILARPISLRDS